MYHLTSIRIAPRGSNVGLVTHWGTRLSINIPEYANEIIFIYGPKMKGCVKLHHW